MKNDAKIKFFYALYTSIAMTSVLSMEHSKFAAFFVFNFIMSLLTIHLKWQKSDRNFSQIYSSPIKYSDLDIFNNYAGFEIQHDNIIQSESLSEFEYAEMVNNNRLKNILIKVVIIILYVAGVKFLLSAKLDILARVSTPIALLVFITTYRYWGMWILGLFVYLISFTAFFTIKTIFSYVIAIIFFMLFFLNMALLNNWYWKRILKQNFKVTPSQFKSVMPSIIIFTTLFCLTDYIVEEDKSLFSKLVEALVKPVQNKNRGHKKMLEFLNSELDSEIKNQLQKIPDLELKDQSILDQLSEISQKMETLEQRDFSFDTDKEKYQLLLDQKKDLLKEAMSKHNPDGDLKLETKKLEDLANEINSEVNIRKERQKELQKLEREQIQRDIKLKKWLKRLAILIGLIIIIYFLNQLMRKGKILEEDFDLTDSQKDELNQIISEHEPHFSNFSDEVDYKYKKVHALLKVLYFGEHSYAPPAMVVPVHDNLAGENKVRVLAAQLGAVFNAIHFSSQKNFKNHQIKEFRHSYRALISIVKRQI